MSYRKTHLGISISNWMLFLWNSVLCLIPDSQSCDSEMQVSQKVKNQCGYLDPLSEVERLNIRSFFHPWNVVSVNLKDTIAVLLRGRCRTPVCGLGRSASLSSFNVLYARGWNPLSNFQNAGFVQWDAVNWTIGLVSIFRTATAFQRSRGKLF